MSEYAFDAAFAPDHFVGEYIAFASRQTDAAHEYQEAVGLALLALVTPDVRVMLRQFPNGLRTNLYLALVGSTSKSRKSTAKDIAVDIIQHVLPTVASQRKRRRRHLLNSLPRTRSSRPCEPSMSSPPR